MTTPGPLQHADGERDRLTDDGDEEHGVERGLLMPVTEHTTDNNGRTHRLLYTSHFLSTWNSRVFEFGAYLFLAELFPHTLLPASVYALARAASGAAFSPCLGSFVDATERLKVVRLSIVGQRLSVALSCTLLFALTRWAVLRESKVGLYALLGCLCLLAATEKLSSALNTIAIERDWVVVIAGDNHDHLGRLNAQMRRIDLLCKLMGPLMVALLDAGSTDIAIIVTGAMTTFSVAVEYFAIARVHHAVPALSEPKTGGGQPTSAPSQPARSILRSCRGAWGSTATYVHHPAFLPSFALALLYLTVLSFAGQMITYLLSLGVHPGTLGVVRGVSALFETSATWLGPRLMQRIGTVRAGIWFINWQLLCVTTACLCLWADMSNTMSVVGTVAAVIASRVGLWGFDLCVQIIVQEEVEPGFRGAFASQESALQNSFEMLSFASTVVFARPEQFEYPATISAVAVGSASVLYAGFVRQRRGHLVHASKCMDRHHRGKHAWSAVPQQHEEAEEEHELAARPNG